jgi:hypothetical protein
MKPVIPNKVAAIVRKDGLAEQTMRAWMETVTQMLESLDIAEGTGSPEGAIFAKQKKLYFNTSGAPGSFLYFKTTNETLDTGWVAIG